MNLFKKSAIVIAILAIAVSAGSDKKNSHKVSYEECIQFTTNAINSVQKVHEDQKIQVLNKQLKTFAGIDEKCSGSKLWTNAIKQNQSNEHLVQCLKMNQFFFNSIKAFPHHQIEAKDSQSVFSSFQGLEANCQNIKEQVDAHQEKKIENNKKILPGAMTKKVKNF